MIIIDKTGTEIENGWGFPISELDYLIEEHDGETFILEDGRLWEAKREKMLNVPLIVVNYCLQVKEITGQFDEEDMANAKKLLDRFKDTMSKDEYLATVGIINRLADLFKGGKR